MGRFRAIGMVGALVASTVGGVVVTSIVEVGPASATPVLTPSIDPTSKASVLAAYRSSLGAARDVPVGWTGSVAGCVVGSEPQTSVDATASAVNFYRAMNKLPPITMDSAYHAKDLAAALMMQAAGAISHTPGNSWPCYTAAGAEGAGNSNLSQGSAAARAVDSYMEDPGDGNSFAGHRRALLFPRASTLGTGSTSSYNALWTNGAVVARPSGVDWIAWPSAGFVPKSLVKPRFSLSSNAMPAADYSNAAVTVKVGSTALPVSVHPPVNGYGDNTLTWEVTLPSGFATGTADVKFDISVSGIENGGNPVATHTYSSTAFVGGAPGVPTGISVSPNSGFAEVDWNAPGDDGGGPITGYILTPYINGVAQDPEVLGNAPFEFYGPLATGATYTFKVQAVNGGGTSAQSALSNGLTLSGSPSAPSAPYHVTAVAGNAQATVSWHAPSATGGSAITGYFVYPFIGGVQGTAVYSAGTGTSKVMTGLTNGTAYQFSVLALNSVGNSNSSALSNAVTPHAPAATVPGAPTTVAATGGNAQATVSWHAPASTGGSAITGYKITPFVGATAKPVVTSSGTGLSKVVTGLTNGTTYTFKVAAVNGVGTGALSSASNAVTPAVVVIPYAPFSSWAAFVARQYQDLLARPPTASESSSWVSQLSGGTKTKGQLDDSLRRSAENLAAVDPVVRIYRAFLQRQPDAGGLQFWIRRKRNVAPAKTWSVTQIATSFTSSNEFKTKYGSLTNRQFVTQIYTDVLGRTADTSGVDFWTRQLDTKKKTKAQVMVGFSESNEYKTKQAQNTDVSVAYIFLMNRAPTSAEATDWVTREKAGTTHAALLTELLNSAKYATHIG